MANDQPIRRMKTYTGTQGYAYQYYFVGKRAALPGGNGYGSAQPRGNGVHASASSGADTELGTSPENA